VAPLSEQAAAQEQQPTADPPGDDSLALLQGNAPAGPPGWVKFDHSDEPLANSVIYAVQGDRTPAGQCHFSGSEVAGSSELPVVERSLAINYEQCAMLLERGNPLEEKPPPPGWETSSESAESGPGSSGSQVPSGSQGLVGPQVSVGAQPSNTNLTDAPTVPFAGTCCFHSGYQRGGSVQNYKSGNVQKWAYHKTYWQDPPGIDVNSIEVQIDWTSSGACANLGNPTRFHAKWGWFSPSGWSKQTSSYNFNLGCEYVTSLASAKYFNGAFCFNEDIWSHYDSTSITGLDDGRYDMTWDTWLESNSALCAGLLSFGRRHGYFDPCCWEQAH
jgi:hypothetical protein